MMIFSRGGRYASSGMRGGQISHALTGDYNKLILNDPNITGQTVILLKDDILNTELLYHLKKNGNKLVLDVIDLLDTDKYDENKNINIPNFFPNIPTDIIDGYIVNSIKMKEWWYNNIHKSPIFVIPHHWEEDFRVLQPKQYDNNPYFYYLGYIGHKEQNCLHLNSLLLNGYVQEHRFNHTNEGYYVDKPVNGCQINIRTKDSYEYCFKPATKISVAAALDSVVITTYDWSVQDLLPKDYPYLLHSTEYEDVVNMIDFVKESVGSTEWDVAKKMMDDVLQKTSLQATIEKYKQVDAFFNN
jgi:hypothetical protein